MVFIMSDIENAQPGEIAPSDENSPVRTKRALTKDEKLQDILLVVSIGQLILAVALYMLAVLNVWVILAAVVAAVALSVASHFKFDSHVPRIILRVLCIFLAAAPFIFWLAFIVPFYFEAMKYNSPEVMQSFMSYFWVTFAIAVLSPLLFLQPCFVLNATARRLFDMVMLRIVTISTFLYSIILSIWALEFQADGSKLIGAPEPVVILGHQFTLGFASDTIAVRILFCACSAALVYCSLLFHSKKHETAESANNDQ